LLKGIVDHQRNTTYIDEAGRLGSLRTVESLGSEIQMFNVKCKDSTGPSVQSYWSMYACTYIKHAVTKVKRMLAKGNQLLKAKVTTPIADKYCINLCNTVDC
jgi:hypothetical protein